MGSESEFSSGGSDHEDSDTIVISSKSRILISPRKKGSKAVSKLLGSAADDVVDQILRGSEGRAEVVSKTKHSTVRAGNKQYVVRDGDGEVDMQFSNSRQIGVTRTTDGAVKREAAPQHTTTKVAATTERRVAEATEVRTAHDRTRYARSSEHAAVADVSEYSDMSSRELSAPSSEEDEYEEEDYYEEEHDHHRGERTQQHTQRQQPAQQQRQPVPQQSQVAHRAGMTRAPIDEQNRSTRVPRMVEQEHHSDSVYAGAADGGSDASSSTKGSSLSQRAPEARPRVQRKFDDHLQTTVQSSCQVHKTSRSEQRIGGGSYEERTAGVGETAKPRVRRDPRGRHVEASDLDDSVILPTSATQEMEDLKQTLKNLAHHDPLMNGSSNGANKTVLLSNPPKKSASFSSNNPRGLDQARKQQYLEQFQNGYQEPAWSATTSALNRFEESTSKISKKLSSGRHATRTATTRHADSESDSDGSEPSVARRLFSTPPQRVSAKTMSTPPTAPASFVSKRTPSPQSALFQTPKTHSGMLDTSFSAATPSTAQGSRAVLSALKALQDKIRRLEEEREKLMQELSDIKVKARKREAEFASNEKKFTYELGQTKESARAAYDAIRSEREELKLELVKYEERRKAMEAELHHAHKLSSTFSAKADDLQAQLQSSETQRASQNAEMEAARGAHKQEVRDMRSELVALQKEKEAAQEQIRQLQAQLERESQSHAETRERLHESEQTVAGITQLNDKLVSKVWEANEIATKATKKSKKLQQSQRVSTLSRPTAASRAASISAANGATTPGRPTSTATKKARAGSISAKNPSSAKKEKRGSQLLGSNNLELLRAANLGRDIPFVLGTSANRSHSIISNVQEAIRQCDTTYATPLTNPPPTPTFLKTRKSSSKLRNASTSASDHLDTISRAGTSASILGIDGAESSTTLVGSRTKARASNGNMSDTAYSAASKRPSSIRVPTPSTSYPNPMKSQIMEDLQTAVETAEAEFTALNRRYKDAVSKVESGRDGAAQLAKGLGAMLDELEAKGKQLNLLKQVYEQASRSTINPVRHVVHSPEAVQRKAASLRILNDYRQMERDAKSPRHGAATPGSPTNTNATSRRASFFSDDG